MEDFSRVRVVAEADALFKDDERSELIFGKVLHCSADRFRYGVEAALVEEHRAEIKLRRGLADTRERAADFGLEQNHDGDNAECREVAQEPYERVELPPLRKDPDDEEKRSAEDIVMHGKNKRIIINRCNINRLNLKHI